MCADLPYKRDLPNNARKRDMLYRLVVDARGVLESYDRSWRQAVEAFHREHPDARRIPEEEYRRLHGWVDYRYERLLEAWETYDALWHRYRIFERWASSPEERRRMREREQQLVAEIRESLRRESISNSE